MHGEPPESRRCCFCLPLRGGLVGWGYLKLVVDIKAIFNIITRQRHVLRNMIITDSLLIFFVTDAIFAVILIAGGHKKSHKLLRAAQIYGIVWFIPMLVLGGYFLFYDFYRMQSRGLPMLYILFHLALDTSFIAVVTFLQVYVVLLLNNEESKLQKQELGTQFRYNAADAETLRVPLDNGQDAHLCTVHRLCTDDRHDVEHK